MQTAILAQKAFTIVYEFTSMKYTLIFILALFIMPAIYSMDRQQLENRHAAIVQCTLKLGDVSMLAPGNPRSAMLTQLLNSCQYIGAGTPEQQIDRLIAFRAEQYGSLLKKREKAQDSLHSVTSEKLRQLECAVLLKHQDRLMQEAESKEWYRRTAVSAFSVAAGILASSMWPKTEKPPKPSDK